MPRAFHFYGFSNGERIEQTDWMAARKRQAVRALAGKPVVQTLALFQQPVTQDQRGYYFAAIIPVFQELTGEPSAMEQHADLVRHLLGLEIDMETGDLVRPSTSDKAMGRDDYSELIERALAFGMVRYGLIFEDEDSYFGRVAMPGQVA